MAIIVENGIAINPKSNETTPERNKRYDIQLKYFLSEEGLEMLRAWARDFTIKDIMEKIGVNRKTFDNWRKLYPEIEDALREGREVIDYRVENALLKAALGYKTKEVKTIINQKPDRDGNRDIRVETIEKEVGPNVTACLAWLTNRKPKEWKRNRDNMFEFDDAKSNINISIIKYDGENEEENKPFNVPAKKSNVNKQNDINDKDDWSVIDDEVEDDDDWDDV